MAILYFLKAAQSVTVKLNCFENTTASFLPIEVGILFNVGYISPTLKSLFISPSVRPSLDSIKARLAGKIFDVTVIPIRL